MKQWTVLLLTFWGVCSAQSPSRTHMSVDPCPGGAGTAKLEVVTQPQSLGQLKQVSELVILGTVATVLPSFVNNPQYPTSIETDSLVSVQQVIKGSVPVGSSSIVLYQIGGEVGRCKVSVPENPIVVAGQQYIFFLREDTRANIPNSTGSPRYYSVGAWSGMVRVGSDNKITFLPRASIGLHKNDSASVPDFISSVLAVH